MTQHIFYAPGKRYYIMGPDSLVLAKAFSLKQAWGFMEEADQFGFDVVDVIDTVPGESVMDQITAQFEGAPSIPDQPQRVHFDESEIPY